MDETQVACQALPQNHKYRSLAVWLRSFGLITAHNTIQLNSVSDSPGSFRGSEEILQQDTSSDMADHSYLYGNVSLQFAPQSTALAIHPDAIMTSAGGSTHGQSPSSISSTHGVANVFTTNRPATILTSKTTDGRRSSAVRSLASLTVFLGCLPLYIVL